MLIIVSVPCMQRYCHARLAKVSASPKTTASRLFSRSGKFQRVEGRAESWKRHPRRLGKHLWCTSTRGTPARNRLGEKGGGRVGHSARRPRQRAPTAGKPPKQTNAGERTPQPRTPRAFRETHKKRPNELLSHSPGASPGTPLACRPRVRLREHRREPAISSPGAPEPPPRQGVHRRVAGHAGVVAAPDVVLVGAASAARAAVVAPRVHLEHAQLLHGGGGGSDGDRVGGRGVGESLEQAHHHLRCHGRGTKSNKPDI